MAEVSLELFKRHCKADDYSSDDEYLQYLLDTAEESVIKATHRTLAELKEIGGGTFPKALSLAAMSLGAHWYNQPESVTVAQMHEVPDSLQSVLKQYRKLGEDEA